MSRRTRKTKASKESENKQEEVPEVVLPESSSLFKSHFIKKLGYRAGISRIRPDAIQGVQKEAEVYLNKVVEKLARRGEETARKHQITFEQTRNVLGIEEVVPEELPSEPCPTFKDTSKKESEKSKSGEVTQRKINFYQEHANCFVLSRTAFAKEVRTRSANYGRVQFLKESLQLLQTAIESHITEVLELALQLSEHRGSKTVEAKDISFVSKRLSGKKN